MMQAANPPASFSFGMNCLLKFTTRTSKEKSFKMYTDLKKTIFVFLLIAYLWTGSTLIAQQSKAAATAGAGLSPEKAVASAEQGHCRENISPLKRAMASKFAAATRKQAGVVGVRCALAVDNSDAALEFIRLLNKQFARGFQMFFS